MRSTIFNSNTVFVITEEPDWTDRPSWEFSLFRDTSTGLSKRERRTPFSLTLLGTAAYTVEVDDADLRQLQGSLRALTTQKVVLPFFPFKTAWADRASDLVQGELMIVWREDWSQYEVYTSDDADPDWPSDEDHWAPAQMGFITASEPEMLSPDSATFKVEFTESSIYAILPAEAEFSDGPQPAAYDVPPKLLPVIPNFLRIKEELRITVNREQIGFSREQADTFFPHEVFRAQEADYLLVDDEPARLLRFFQEFAAPGSAFWAPSWLRVAVLTADVDAADTVLQVIDTTAIVVGDYLAFDTEELTFGKVQSKTANTITLTAEIGTDLSASLHSVYPLSLARLDEPKIKFTWLSPNCVSCTIPWTEMRAEVTPAADETLGDTLGRGPTRIILFEFIRDYGNGTVLHSRFTSFERDINDGVNNWTGNSKFSHGAIKQGLNLENDKVDITTFIVTGNPLLDDAAIRSEAPLNCVIRWAKYDGESLSNIVVMFSGRISSPARAGKKITASILAGPGGLDTQGPRMLHGVTCNHVNGSNNDGSFLMSFGCTLLRSDWKFSTTVQTAPTGGWPYQLALHSLDRVVGTDPTYFTDWFALGVCEWGAGAALQRRYILKSTLPVAGALTITIQKLFEGDGPQVGDTVYLFPGCDGQAGTCRAYDADTNPLGKFDNYDLNFGGEEFTPAGNPSLLKLNTPTTAGGKK